MPDIRTRIAGSLHELSASSFVRVCGDKGGEVGGDKEGEEEGDTGAKKGGAGGKNAPRQPPSTREG